MITNRRDRNRVTWRSSRTGRGCALESLLGVETAAVGGAAIGLVMAWVARVVDPVVCVLSVAALAALIAATACAPSPKVMLIPRLLLAGVYVAAGVRDPTTLGIAVAVAGASLGVFSYAAFLSTARSAALRPARWGPHDT